MVVDNESNNVEVPDLLANSEFFSEGFDLDAALDMLEAIDNEGLLDMPEKPKPVTSQDRMERGFQEIVDFRREHGRNPSPDTHDISERRLGARLDGFLADPERAESVRHLDTEFGLLNGPAAPESLDDLLSGNFDLSLLETDADMDLFDVSSLPRTQDVEDVEVAQRERAKDFETFKPLFKQKHAELADGACVLRPFAGIHQVQEGQFFVLNGVMLFVADVHETEQVKHADRTVSKERLRVIFENGTESSMYRQSLAGRLGESNGQIVARNTSLDTTEILDADIRSGYIYVLASESKDPAIQGIKNLHKIGFTTTSVETRIANAEHEPTYLMAPVRVISTYRVYNVRPSAVENLLHHVFSAVRLDLTQVGLDGKNHDVTEWFVVPYERIDEAIGKLIAGELGRYVYEPSLEEFVTSSGSGL